MKSRCLKILFAAMFALVLASPAWADAVSDDIAIVEAAIDNVGPLTSPEIDAARALLDSAKAHQSAGRTDEAEVDIEEAKSLLTIE